MSSLQQGGPGGSPGADVHVEACPRFSIGGEHDLLGVVLKRGILKACLGLGLGED